MTEDRSLLDPLTLRQLLRELEKTDVDELEVSAGSSRLYIRRDPGKNGAMQVVGPAPASAPAGVPILAPLTGVYYSRPTPDQAPYVEVGDEVTPGQVVCVIETMKIYNPVAAEIEGEVVEIAVRDGGLIEAGQPIMYVLPHGGE